MYSIFLPQIMNENHYALKKQCLKRPYIPSTFPQPPHYCKTTFVFFPYFCKIFDSEIYYKSASFVRGLLHRARKTLIKLKRLVTCYLLHNKPIWPPKSLPALRVHFCLFQMLFFGKPTQLESAVRPRLDRLQRALALA